jgi:hypothetical protein
MATTPAGTGAVEARSAVQPRGVVRVEKPAGPRLAVPALAPTAGPRPGSSMRWSFGPSLRSSRTPVRRDGLDDEATSPGCG